MKRINNLRRGIAAAILAALVLAVLPCRLAAQPPPQPSLPPVNPPENAPQTTTGPRPLRTIGAPPATMPPVAPLDLFTGQGRSWPGYASGPVNPPAAPDPEALKAWAAIGPPATNIIYEGLPLSEVVRDVGELFKNQFDVILSSKSEAKNVPIDLRLKYAQAADVFNAMNLLFETDDAPYRWKLVLNGERPTAVFQTLRSPFALPRQAPQSTVLYVGNLLSDPAGQGLSPEALEKAIRQVQEDVSTRNEEPPHIAFHWETGLLVVSGTPAQVSLTEGTLRALQVKLNEDAGRAKYKAAAEREAQHLNTK